MNFQKSMDQLNGKGFDMLKLKIYKLRLFLLAFNGDYSCLNLNLLSNSSVFNTIDSRVILLSIIRAYLIDPLTLIAKAENLLKWQSIKSLYVNVSSAKIFLYSVTTLSPSSHLS